MFFLCEPVTATYKYFNNHYTVILKNCTLHLSDDGEMSSHQDENSFGLQLSCTPQIFGVNISIMSYLVSIYAIENQNTTLIFNQEFPANISDHSLVEVTLSVGDPYPKPKYIIILRSLFERNGTIYKGQRTDISLEIGMPSTFHSIFVEL